MLVAACLLCVLLRLRYVTNAAQSATPLEITATDGSFNSDLVRITSARAASTSFDMLQLDANGVEGFAIRGDGFVTVTNSLYV